MLTFAAVAWTLDRALGALLTTSIAQLLHSVRERNDAILRTLHRIVVLATWIVGVTMFALSYSALDDVIRVVTFVAKASITIGDVTITLNAVLLALGVAVLTWIVTRIVRFVLDHELLPRLNLRAGVPVAISTIIGYALVVTGFVLAMAALGIDLTKVTLLAGAVGVGVGFGLQNVVNNFASGLILMLERPINVGDQIDVGGVVGEVKRIGVRSSTIRTSQGAEVIVPNSDLAGKQVTNWTLSDRARRFEIDVGVAYGSDPAQVLRLLEAAAASVQEVQKKPAPRAQFTGFGQSSLDFRLYAWVESVDVGLEAQNGLRMAILKTLGDAGIEIPFPQQELRIRQLSAAAELTGVPRAVS
jgi:small-conductance mechanosensitive channel